MKTKDILKHLSILYLEDDQEVMDNISKTLSFMVKDVYLASSVSEALELYDLKSPDIIISDISMEDSDTLDGLDFVAKVRENDRFIPIIITTAYKDKSFLMRAMGMYLESYIVKPISYEALKNVLFKSVKSIVDSGKFEIVFPTGCTYNLKTFIFRNKNGDIEKLQKKEKLILDTLLEHINEVTPYYLIEQNAWEAETLNKNTLKTIIGQLRHKVGKDTIVNENEIGYKLII